MMKKVLKPIIGFSLLFLLFTNCEKGDRTSINQKHLIGVWFIENFIEEYSRISRLEYHFHIDNTYEVLRIEINPYTREVLGYRWRELGIYEVYDDQLSFYISEKYGNNDEQSSYSEIENLILVVDNEKSYYVNIHFENSGGNVVFTYPPCPPNANCLSSRTLIRQ